ncbi:hypothetical protein [Streptomyces sp. NPDC057554]|uniref:restriction endonuclease subunit S n=1 Tax=Streptomyces sp. NPDC057554 TaxID=3350538 RepID=UPI0036907AD6
MRGEDASVRTVRLASVLKQNPGNGYSPKDVPGFTGLQALGLGCLTSEGFFPHQLKNVPDTPLARRFRLEDGDLLMSRANTRELVGLAGRFKDVGHPCIYPDLMMRLRPDENVCLPEYLEIVLRSSAVRRAVRAGARGTSDSMVKIGAALVGGLQVPLLQIGEQKRIVAAHAAFEQRIAALERVATKREAVLEAQVESQFMAFRNSTADLRSFSESCRSGITLGPERSPRSRTAAYLRVANVQKGWIDASDLAWLESNENDKPRYELESGDLLVVEGHGNPDQIGRAAVVGPREDGLLYQNHLFRVRFTGVIPEFAMLWLNSTAVRKYWRSRCTTSSGLYTINSGLLGKVPFPEVDLSEQQRIVRSWRAGLECLNSVKQQIVKLRILQRGAAEDLLGSGLR